MCLDCRSLRDSALSAVPEGLVEPPVEEGVVAGGGHREGVAGEEGHVVPPPAVHTGVQIYPGCALIGRE